jgi:DNA-binding transcriptional regulator PaaX
MRLVIFDEKRRLYRLRVIPNGTDAVGDAVLVLLYGALRLKGEDEMLATRLMGALQGSGINVGRVDRDAATHMRERWITRYGVGKGGRYRLTSTGMIRAREVAEALLGQIAG